MKHLLAASALLGLSVLANACGTDVDPADRAQFPTGNVQYTLLMYDGLSGAPLENATVSIQVGTESIVAERVGNSYVASGLPGGSFPVTLSADGYITRSALVQFTGTSVTSFQAPAFVNQYAQMFPTQSITSDQTVRVFLENDGTAVNSGQVLAVLTNIDDNVVGPPLGTGYAPFNGSYGVFPQVITANISAAGATLPRDQLVFGASYTISLVGVQTAQGGYLSGTATFVAGTTPNPIVIYAGQEGVEVRVVSASNEVGRGPTGNGALTLTFPYQVETCTEQSTWTFTPSAGVPANNTVQVAGNGSTELRFTPSFDSALDDGTLPTFSVTLNGIGIRARGNPTCSTLGVGGGSGIRIRNTNTAVSNSVRTR